MDNEKLVSPYVPSQFPRQYKETPPQFTEFATIDRQNKDNYPQFVEFVRTYYLWLEQANQALGHAHRLQEYRDIDETKEDFITYFKNKFLPYLKFVTDIDKRTLVKHVQDLYRSKGTDRGIDLFFKLVYGVPADVYYPSTDLFRLSDNTWVKRKYLEITHLELINEFIGKKIIGTRSGATAFAERFVQKKVGDSYINILFISNVEGDFIYNEKLTYEGLAIGDKKRPRVMGSLTQLQITSGSKNFKVGDLVTVESAHGYGARARVSNTYDSSGTVDFKLEDGGWGYTTLAEVYVSDKIMTITNVVPDYVINNPDKPEYDASPFFLLEEVYQPFYRFDYSFTSSYQSVVVNKPASSWFANSVTVYQTDGAVNVAVGTIVSNSAINSSAQSLVINIDKSQTDISDFYATAGSYGKIILDTNSSVNSTVLTVNASINTATIAVSSNLKSYNSTGGVISTVQVVKTDITDAKSGNLLVYVLSGTPTTNSHFWGDSNTYSVNVTTFADKTATASVVAFGNNITMYISNSSSFFSVGQYLTQRRTYPGGYSISAKGKIGGIQYVGNSAIVGLKETTGVFRPNINVYMQNSVGGETGQIAYLNSYDGTLGVTNIQNDFIVSGNNRIFSYSSNTTANLTVLSSGKHATFNIANTFTYAEEYSIYTDLVGGNNVNTPNVPYMGLSLNAAEWYFPKAVALGGYSNATAHLKDVLAIVNGYIGGISKLEKINPGEDYNLAPYVLVKDPYVSGFNRKDFIITSTNVNGSFTVGEQVIQDNGATGQIKRITIATNGTHTIYVRRQRVNIDFTVGETMTGETTATTAVISGVTEDDSSPPIGLNAVITANVAVADGIVGGLEILASGFGFREDEEATFTSEDGLKAGTAKAKLINQGITDGVFMDESSFVSSSKYLFDGDYYQEYSYDIQAAIPREAYKDNYLSTMHLAGTKMFSTFVHSTINDVSIDVSLPELSANLTADTI